MTEQFTLCIYFWWGNVLKSFPEVSHIILTKFHRVGTVRPFQSWRNWDSKRLRDFSNVIQQGCNWQRQLVLTKYSDATLDYWAFWHVGGALVNNQDGLNGTRVAMTYAPPGWSRWELVHCPYSHSLPLWPLRRSWLQVWWWACNPHRAVTLERTELLPIKTLRFQDVFLCTSS